MLMLNHVNKGALGHIGHVVPEISDPGFYCNGWWSIMYKERCLVGSRDVEVRHVSKAGHVSVTIN